VESEQIKPDEYQINPIPALLDELKIPSSPIPGHVYIPLTFFIHPNPRKEVKHRKNISRFSIYLFLLFLLFFFKH
jgi:hypothetical protein